MSVKREWLIFFIVLTVAFGILFNLRFLGLSVANTTSNVTVASLNTPPAIGSINDSLYVCENEILDYEFNVTDIDGDVLIGSINPENPFFVFWIRQPAVSVTTFAIVSSSISKVIIGGVNSGNKTYVENVSVKDDFSSSCCFDYKQTNITAIEINNGPLIEDVGVKTVWTSGDNSNFYEVVAVNDTEYNLGYGTLNFTVSIFNSSGISLNLFNITSSGGVINFTANSSTVLGVYNVTVCVNDTGLSNPFVNISSVCSQTGGSLSACDNFSLTVTSSNRAPNITAYYPTSLSFSSSGTDSLYFNITKYDVDGTIPDAYWYVDSVLKEYDSGSSVDSFSYSYGCGVSGAHNVTVNVTDGLLWTSLTWNVSVQSVSCSSTSGGSAGGGGAGAGIISERFSIEPQFIATKIFKGEGKSFDIKIKNVGSVDANIVTGIENISDLALVSEDNFLLKVGEEKIVKVYLYSLSIAKSGVYYGKIFFQGQTTKVAVSVVLEVKDREPLFDISVEVLPDYKTVTAGDDMTVSVNMLNVGLYGTAVDVEFYLFITDFNRLIIYETSKEMVAVEKNVSLLRDLRVPFDTSSGNYLVLAQASYGNISATSYDTFAVVEKKYLRAAYFLILMFILALLLLILFLIWKRRKKKKEEERYR
ncbi:MAG: hypothetical protein AABW50_01580 [Nanoarchaeota archaeon]